MTATEKAKAGRQKSGVRSQRRTACGRLRESVTPGLRLREELRVSSCDLVEGFGTGNKTDPRSHTNLHKKTTQYFLRACLEHDTKFPGTQRDPCL